MISVIGIGDIGCNVAACFNKYPQYEVYTISEADYDNCNSLVIKDRESPEEYESHAPNVKSFFKGIKSESLVVVSGCDYASASTLAILSQIKDKTQINVLYIKPEVEFLSANQRLNERAVRLILQQYGLSGVFKSLCIVDNERLQDAIGDVPVTKLRPAMSKFTCNTYHMVKVFHNTQPKIGNLQSNIRTNAISTISILDPESGQVTQFSDLPHPKALEFLYGIPKKALDEDSTLLKRVRKQVRDSENSGPKYYGIFETAYERDCAFVIQYSRETQK
jgi:hypothetical protein